MLKILETAPEGKVPDALDELAREGARRMLVEALDAEVADYVERGRAEHGEDVRAVGAQEWGAVASGRRSVLARWRCKRRASTIAVRVIPLPVRSCRRTCVARRSSPRCFRRGTFAGCFRVTSRKRLTPCRGTGPRACPLPALRG